MQPRTSASILVVKSPLTMLEIRRMHANKASHELLARTNTWLTSSSHQNFYAEMLFSCPSLFGLWLWCVKLKRHLVNAKNLYNSRIRSSCCFKGCPINLPMTPNKPHPNSFTFSSTSQPCLVTACNSLTCSRQRKCMWFREVLPNRAYNALHLQETILSSPVRGHSRRSGWVQLWLLAWHGSFVCLALRRQLLGLGLGLAFGCRVMLLIILIQVDRLYFPLSKLPLLLFFELQVMLSFAFPLRCFRECLFLHLAA